jgi:hypothetical protein
MDAQIHHWLNLQLKYLQMGHRVAIATWAEGLELVGIQQGFDHPILIAQVGGQPFGLVAHVKLQLLTGAEGQGHGLRAGAA